MRRILCRLFGHTINATSELWKKELVAAGYEVAVRGACPRCKVVVTVGLLPLDGPSSLSVDACLHLKQFADVAGEASALLRRLSRVQRDRPNLFAQYRDLSAALQKAQGYLCGLSGRHVLHSSAKDPAPHTRGH